MRELKFRAWDSMTEQFYEWGYIYDTFIRPPARDGWKFDHCQYTGLKDKNGVEIYEGDLLFDGEVVGLVAFQDGQFLYQDSTVSHQLFDAADSCEVVGNIHENPELLK